ncbi:MAG: hypothetical protein E6J32_07080 [Chloroflexi bacterium]|nr:MAG: hypothetical protein E6J32_07080 [Chloroflexota bacterium]
MTVAEGDDLDQVEVVELVLFILRGHELEMREVVLVALDRGDDRGDAAMDLRVGLGQLRLDFARRNLRSADGLGHLRGAARLGGVELYDQVVAGFLDGADQNHLRVVIRRLDHGDGRVFVVAVGDDHEGRRDGRHRQHAHRGDRDDPLADPGQEKREHYDETSLRTGSSARMNAP